jgi:hypothetical protein
MMAMVGRNDDSQATSSKYLVCKRNLRAGLGKSIVDRPLAQKENDELAGRFRFGKTFLLTDLRYRCTSNTGGMRNIQYGLDDLGYAVGVLTSQQLHGRVKGPKVLRRGRVPEE